MTDLEKNMMLAELETVLQRHDFQGGVFMLVNRNGITQFTIARENKEFITGLHGYVNASVNQVMRRSATQVIVKDGGSA